MSNKTPGPGLLLPDDQPDTEKTTAMVIAQKKVAIEGALSAYLPQDSIGNVVRIWEEKYALQPTFALQRFLNEFCNNETLKSQRSQILQSLIRALSGADGRPLEGSTSSAIAAMAASVATPAAANNAAVQCCTRLIENVFARTPGDMHVKMRLYLIGNLPGMKLPQASVRALQAWLSQQYRIPADISIEDKALRHLVNLSYISLCEFLGPVKADQLLHEAVVLTESAVPDYPVRNLL